MDKVVAMPTRFGLGFVLNLPIVPGFPEYASLGGTCWVEFLELRAGGGIEGGPGTRIEERSLDAIQKLIDEHNAQRPKWRQPENIGDTAYLQKEMDLS